MFQKHSVICEIVHYKKYSGHAFQCQNCKRSFRSDIELTRHQNGHSSIRFNCEFCEATFSTNHNKKAHMVKFHKVPKMTQKRVSEETVENLEKKANDAIEAADGFEKSALCTICFVNPRKIMLLPCLHFDFCKVCIDASTDNICYTCQAPIEKKLEAYVS